MQTLKEKILEKLKTIYEPCFPVVDIVRMGLIYGIDIDKDNNVKITMTFTSQLCPAAVRLQEKVKQLAQTVEGVNSVDVVLTFDPPWTPDKLSKEDRELLGYI
ncbi:metal-sulfur cluster assembly factor [Hippea jasoniae]|uniref:metal-sulfur cluster assembly factor n=1 Tax=Hippea jasoniae TaxID=944479 RepID=UPI00054DD477|nr:metal-sulfur cluster assembly factor [Hippea jasoniae]